MELTPCVCIGLGRGIHTAGCQYSHRESRGKKKSEVMLWFLFQLPVRQHQGFNKQENGSVSALVAERRELMSRKHVWDSKSCDIWHQKKSHRVEVPPRSWPGRIANLCHECRKASKKIFPQNLQILKKYCSICGFNVVWRSWCCSVSCRKPVWVQSCPSAENWSAW